MSFTAHEESLYSGKPDELYEFEIGTSKQFYTSSNDDIVKDGDTYEAVPIKRSEVHLESELNKASLTIEVSADHPIPELFRIAPPDVVVRVSIYRRHAEESEYKVVWKGRIVNVSWLEDSVNIACEQISTSLKQPGLRRVYSRNCHHQVYDEYCRAQNADFRVIGTAAEVGNVTVNCAEAELYANGYFDGGYIEWDGAYGNKNTRTILTHVGRVLTLLSSSHGLNQFDEVWMYPGCNQKSSTCDGKFNNMPNYGGFKNKPTKDPFNDQVF